MITGAGRCAAMLAGVLLCGVALLGGTTACAGKPAKPLTPQQLQAGVVPKNHPVSQQAARAVTCRCHFQKRQQ